MIKKSRLNKSQKSGRSSPQTTNVHAERDVLRAAAATHASELDDMRASLVKVTTERDLAVTVGAMVMSFCIVDVSSLVDIRNFDGKGASAAFFHDELLSAFGAGVYSDD
jgi:hypothetical protein